jgi:uncharacterized protein (DUF2336 family)
MEPSEILALAKSSDPQDRERLLLTLVDLCAAGEHKDVRIEPTVQALMNSVFMTLVANAEREIRQALSQRLASVEWAPHALINVLALDEIEIARPVIAQSPVLEDADLIRILALATLEHQVSVAARPAIGQDIVQKLLAIDDPSVMTALASNDTADIPEAGMARLLSASRKIASIRSPLVRHPRLTPPMAEQLYVWVGQSLRSAIVSRFRVDAEALDREIAAAVKSSQFGDVIASERTSPAGASHEDKAEMERRLVEKLHDSGQLRPGFLIKALRDQRLGLFVAALARRIEVPLATIQHAINADQPQLLALACVSAGIDRSAYDTVLSLVRDLNRGRPGGGPEEGRRAMAAFGVGDPEKARTVLKRVAAG